MILIEKQWDESLSALSYEDGYDIRVHALQTALNLISRRSVLVGSKMQDVNFSSVKFGYYDVETEHAIKEFQKNVGIPTSSIVDKYTYESIFQIVREELKSIIIETKDKEVKIYEFTEEYSQLFQDGNTGTLDGIYDDLIDSSINGNLSSGSDFDYELNAQSTEFYNDFEYGLDYSAYNWSNDSFWSYLNNQFDDVLNVFTKSRVFGSGGSNNASYNLNGEESYSLNESNLTDIGSGVTFIDGLLANSIYQGNFDYSRPIAWNSKSNMSINIDGFSYENSEKHDTFFTDDNISLTRKSGYDITIVYGPNGRFAKKILDVRPRGKSQQIDASGEAIFDIIDFIAKDIVETDSHRTQFAY